jgi:hypothetical protein
MKTVTTQNTTKQTRSTQRPYPRMGIEPDQVLSQQALSQGNITCIDRRQLEQAQLNRVGTCFKARND